MGSPCRISKTSARPCLLATFVLKEVLSNLQSCTTHETCIGSSRSAEASGGQADKGSREGGRAREGSWSEKRERELQVLSWICDMDSFTRHLCRLMTSSTDTSNCTERRPLNDGVVALASCAL